MKVLYFDTETTGTDPKIHEITQFAGIVEIDGKGVQEFNWRCQPTRWNTIDLGALKVTGIGIEDLKKNEPAKVMYERIRQLLDKYIPKYTKIFDKFYPAGHNVTFDLQFFDAFVRQHGDADATKWGSVTWQNWRSMDTRVLANYLSAEGKLKLPDLKLETLCGHYGIELKAHDAMSDIRATMELNKYLRRDMRGTK